MYDISHDNMVTKESLSLLLNQVPKSSLSSHKDSFRFSTADSKELDTTNNKEFDNYNSDNDYEEVDEYTNHYLVEEAFSECNINNDGCLCFEEFKMWVENNPSMIEYIESILPYYGHKDLFPHIHRKENLPHMKRIVNQSKCLSRSSSAGELHSNSISNRLNGLLSDDSEASLDVEEQARLCLVQALELSQNEVLKASITKILETLPNNKGLINVERLNSENIYQSYVAEDYLWKSGAALHQKIKRFYVLSGNCMYYYSNKTDLRPKGVIFLTGCIIERVVDDKQELKGYYGFELLHQDLCTGEHHRHEKRILYCRNSKVRDEWVQKLQHAAQVIPIEEDYVIGHEIGKGRFSIVCECVNKKTMEISAVKIIDKTVVEPEEKSLLRTEIAVLKLVNHPNIIRMKGLYESKKYIYIVMEMLKGGELFEHIVGKPRFSEEQTAKLIKPLLESVAYLHDLGIAHNDLKPENILCCGDNIEDLKIADFGLSKLLLPKEKMIAACGTLSYVAPEVLTMQGYGKEADLWSVGVIMFLVLCGKLPFDGQNHNEIIRCTIAAEVRVSSAIWWKLSDNARSLIQSLLKKDPKLRISAKNALKSPFITDFNPQRRHSRSNSSAPITPNITDKFSAPLTPTTPNSNKISIITPISPTLLGNSQFPSSHNSSSKIVKVP